MNQPNVLDSDLWQSLELSEKKLELAILALKDIAIWNDGLQEEVEKDGKGISMWISCVVQAKNVLEKIDSL